MEPEEPVMRSLPSPRTLRKERMQSAAAERMAATRARMNFYEQKLDAFMGY